jgi:DeoR/GlpR family transcriptional regulator of sugar metabolism
VLAQQRQEAILREVDRIGGARVSELVDLLGVSDMTVRRDIEALAVNGLVLRVHGGAAAVAGRSTEEPGFQMKSGMNPGQKSAIARVAAQLITPGSSVAISAGTTTYAVAQELMNVPNLTVVTNSPRVADLVHGIDPVAGLTTPNLIEAATNRALIASARRVIVVADHSKWGVIGLSAIATLDQVDVLVTDAELDTEARRIVSEQVGQLIEAQVSDCEADNKPRKVTSS